MNKKTKQFLSFLLTVMLIAGMFNVPSVLASTEETVVEWNYTAAPTPNAQIAPATGGANKTGAVLTNSIPKDMTYSTSSLCLVGETGKNWTSGSEYWQIEFSTVGYKNLTITAKGRSSNTGPRDFELQYSVNGSDFLPVADSAYSFVGTTINFIKTNPIILPSAINDKANVRIRFINTSTISVNGGTTAATGPSNINNIIIKGTTTSGGSDPEPITKCATPTANPVAGQVEEGTTVTFSTTTTGTAIQYNTVSATEDEADWTTGDTVTVNAPTTYYVRAIDNTGSGLDNSDVATFAYTIKPASGTVLNIKQALELANGTTGVTVTGQVAYFANTSKNFTIQENIDGNIYSLYIFKSNPAGINIGDTVKITGTYKIYNGLPEMDSISLIEKTGTQSKMSAETVTIADLVANGKNMLGRFVKIAGVTLGKYNGTGETPITFGTDTIKIYRGSPYPFGVAEGDVVDLYAMVNCYNATIQLSTGTAEDNGFQVYDLVNNTKNPVLTLPDTFTAAKIGQDYIISVEANAYKGIKSAVIDYTVGSVTKTAQSMIKNATTGKYEYTIPASEIVDTAGNIKFTITITGDNDRTATSGEITIEIDSKPQIVKVNPTYNSYTGDDKTPEISVKLENAGIDPSVKVSLKKGEEIIFENQTMSLKAGETAEYTYKNETLLSDGKYTATVTVIRSDSQSTSETWNFNVGKSVYQAYFGQLHSHTAQYSDGSGTLQDGLNYFTGIPAGDNVNFIAFTDHSNYFDTSNEANLAIALNDKALMTAASRATWEEYVNTMTAFNTVNAGNRVAMPGFEMTWSGGPGHINTFNSKGLVSRNNTALNNKTGDAGLKLYYDTLVADTDPLANLSQFNHPGKTFGTFADFAYWNPIIDLKMFAVEVGNGEGGIGSGGYFPSFGEYTKALDKGWHVGPSNNQDNHKGYWGNSNTARTVIFTDELSTDGLLRGMKARSMYATEDKNLNIQYTLNGQIMGSIINDIPTSPLKFVLNIDDLDKDDNISKVEIITNGGRVVKSESFNSNVVNMEFELPVVKGYYYVRVTQADKNIAVTAPVWIGNAAIMGITSVECDTIMPVTNEELTINTTIFNNEATDATIKSITYSMNDSVLESKTPNTVVSPSGTVKESFKITPDKAGIAILNVNVVLTLNGEDKEFNQNVELNIRDSEKLVYVGIDASHYNEYVNGNYKDSMGNFAKLATDYDVRVVELKTSEELINATNNQKYKMLVLTPPTRRNGSNFLIGYKSYTDDEVAAIAEFARKGGTVILTGWGDFYESYTKFSDNTPHILPADQHMAAQQNKILTAIGASLRISDDEIKDDINNSDPASNPKNNMRLYLKNYNMSNQFLSGVKPIEQVYSNYGGSTVYAVGEDKEPTSILPSHVSPMVFAFDTGYSADDDKDGYAGVTIPKYNGKYMVAASETVSHANGTKSTVIVAGSAFMSNFEIQVTLDSYATPAYSNYTILENVVQSINPVTITDIATVQAADEDETFTIRGIVTSNASGYDKDTAFFDCIYLQDNTAGINAFPVAGDIRAGQTVEIRGVTSSYNGERQIAVKKITIIDSDIKELPKAIAETSAQAANGNNLGSLVTVKGRVVSMTTPNNIVESIYVMDASGVACRVFIDGYITKDKTIANLVVGANITATGLSSIDTEGARIRIRDRADIICTPYVPIDDLDDSTGGGKTGTTPPTTPEPADKFNDINTSAWYYKAVNFVVKNGLFEGVSENNFAPDKTMTRSMLVTVLWRLEEKPATNASSGFKDVSSGEWYGTAIAWATQNKIVQGISGDIFAPNANITREQLAVILYRYQQVSGKIPADTVTKTDFADSNNISDYAKEAVKTLAAQGIIDGKDGNNFDPKGVATRAEVATMLFRFIQAIK